MKLYPEDLRKLHGKTVCSITDCGTFGILFTFTDGSRLQFDGFGRDGFGHSPVVYGRVELPERKASKSTKTQKRASAP